MTHESEYTFMDAVEAFLDGYYSKFEREHVLPSQRRPDFVVWTAMGTVAVEVENDFEAAIKGAGQAQMYAAEVEETYYGPCEPLVIVPSGHVENPEVEYLPVPVYEVPDEPPFEE